MRVYKIRTVDPGERLYRNLSKVFETKDDNGKKKKLTVVHRVANVPINPDGSLKQLPIDQFSGKSFLRNACGWPMNDIMAYEETQNESIARAVLSRINVVAPSSGDGLSDVERFERIVPANYSSPAEFLSISEKFARMSYAQMQDKAAAAAAAAAAKDSKKEPDKVVLPAEPE